MISPEDPLIENRYANWVSQTIAYVNPTHLQVIAGRGTSKTTQIHAERFQEALLEMPRSLQMFLCNTYENARTNLVPGLEVGWKEFRDWQYGIDYVYGEPPPSFFAKPFVPVSNTKNTIYHREGAAIVVGSAAQVSGLAGNSYQYMGADEVKYIGKDKMDIILPALRGFNMFPHSSYYLGTTFTTDLPNLGKGDEPWVLDLKKNSDMERAKVSFYCGYAYYQNEAKIAKAIKFKQKARLKKLLKTRGRLKKEWLRVIKGGDGKKDLSYFMITSSFANIDVLTLRYLENLMTTLGWEEFKQSVLSLKGGVEEGDKFYSGLNEQHFYRDGINEGYDSKLGLHDEATCNILRYLDPNAELDAGMDFGRMLSMVIAQERGNELRCLKNIIKLVPESSRELADHFIRFFEPHKNKVLNLYYDRSGNQYASSGRDWASEMKDVLEIDRYGKRTGWTVNLMSKEQATIYQSEEFHLMKQILSEDNEDLPKLKICVDQCRELKSSMELTKIKVKTDTKTGKKTIHKDKSSEKLPLHQLPMNSTNCGDAFKYLMYRKRWANIGKRKRNRVSTALTGN